MMLHVQAKKMLHKLALRNASIVHTMFRPVGGARTVSFVAGDVGKPILSNVYAASVMAVVGPHESMAYWIRPKIRSD